MAITQKWVQEKLTLRAHELARWFEGALEDLEGRDLSTVETAIHRIVKDYTGEDIQQLSFDAFLSWNNNDPLLDWFRHPHELAELYSLTIHHGKCQRWL